MQRNTGISISSSKRIKVGHDGGLFFQLLRWEFLTYFLNIRKKLFSSFGKKYSKKFY